MANSLQTEAMSPFCCSPEAHSISGYYGLVIQMFNLDSPREGEKEVASLLPLGWRIYIPFLNADILLQSEGVKCSQKGPRWCV